MAWWDAGQRDRRRGRRCPLRSVSGLSVSYTHLAYAAAAYLGSQSLVVAAVVDSLNYGPHLVVRTMGAGDRARDGALTQTQGADESVAGVRGQITAPVLLGLSDTLFAVWRQDVYKRQRIR